MIGLFDLSSLMVVAGDNWGWLLAALIAGLATGWISCKPMPLSDNGA